MKKLIIPILHIMTIMSFAIISTKIQTWFEKDFIKQDIININII